MSEFVTVLLIAIRVAGFLFTAPVFSSSNVPQTVKLYFSFVLAYIIYFTIPHFNFDPTSSFVLLIVLAVKEALAGVIMGFCLNFVFYGVSMAGVLIGFELGLSMAQMFDPSQEVENNIIGQALSMAALTIFFVINGHQYMISALAQSFKILQLGHMNFNEAALNMLIRLSAGMFVIAVKIAAPIMVSFFLLNIASGIMSRMIPQLQVFFVLMPIKAWLGLILVIALFPLFVFLISELLKNIEVDLLTMAKLLSQ